jgi:hypothetical protein
VGGSIANVGFFRRDHESDPSEVVQLEDLGTSGIKIDLVIIAVCVVLLLIFGTGGAVGGLLWTMIAVCVAAGCLQAWRLVKPKDTSERKNKKG